MCKTTNEMLVYDRSKSLKSLNKYIKSSNIENFNIFKFYMFEDPRRHSENFKISFNEILVKQISSQQNVFVISLQHVEFVKNNI